MNKDLLNVIGLKTYFYTSYGVVKAVDGVSIAVGQKESVGLVGESGCGKTMTTFSLMRLVPSPGKIIEGQIMFRDKDLLQRAPPKMFAGQRYLPRT